MSNLSDKDIDRLSKEAADLYEPGQSNLSWSRLEQRLTEQMPGRPPDGFRFGRIGPYAWGPAVVLFAGISFYLIKNIDYSQHSTRTNQITTSQADSFSSTDKKNASSHIPDESAITHSIPAASSNKNLTQQNNNTANYLAASHNETENLKKASRSKYLSIASGTTVVSSDFIHGKPSGSDTFNKSNGSNAVINNNTAAKNKERFPLVLPSIITISAHRGKITGNDSLLNRLNELKAPFPHKSLHLNRSLNFGIAFGPDYTNGGGIPNNEFSNNLGITIGYYLTNKISLNAGILYSNKFFWAPGKKGIFVGRSGLTPGYASNYAAPPQIEYVNGSANLYEVPLTLRYDIAQDEKTKFFVNAGLSSYFMIKQTSIYFSGRTPLALERSDDSQMNYWFNVASLSLGFETDMGKGFSFQMEPFVKLPLKNMGIEDVRLNSYGMMLSFRFAPLLGRTRK